MCSLVSPPKQEQKAVDTMAISVIYLTFFLVYVQVGLAAVCCAGVRVLLVWTRCAGVWLLLLVWIFSSQVKAGIVMNVIGVLCVTLAINTWGRPMFSLDTLPAWANTTTSQ